MREANPASMSGMSRTMCGLFGVRRTSNPTDKKGEEDSPHRGGGQLVRVPFEGHQSLLSTSCARTQETAPSNLTGLFLVPGRLLFGSGSETSLTHGELNVLPNQLLGVDIAF